MKAAEARKVTDVLADPHDPSLGDCFRGWSHHSMPWIIGAAVLVAWSVRVALGGWSIHDLIPILVVLASQPFTEWAIHTYVLHLRPLRIGGRRIELPAAREHRRHHGDPKAFEPIFIPHLDLFVASGLTLAALLALLPVRTAVTAFAFASTMTFVYEWTHYLIHTPYRPRHAYYRRIARGHRLHHYRNEHFWMGVTVDLADHVLGTAPRRSDVPRSETARTLS